MRKLGKATISAQLCGIGALGFLVLSLFVSRPAFADEQDLATQLKNCKSITSIVLRSKCYDETVDDYNLKTFERVAVGAGDPGKWQSTFEKSPLNDAQNVYLSLIGNDYFSNKNGKFSRPSLVLRCAEGKTEAYVIFDTDIGQTDPLYNSRIGTQPVIAGYAKRSGDNLATFIPDAKTVAQKLLTETVFYYKIWPTTMDTVGSTFDVRGLTAAIVPLRKACNW